MQNLEVDGSFFPLNLVLSAIEGVLGPNVDATLRTPVCELEPGVVLDTLEECMAMVTKQMEPECLRALNLNALAGG